MIYIYAGLRFVEPIKNPNIYIYFWIAYIIFGITLFNIIVISNFWAKLSTKIGPPGPIGPRGDDGDLGPTGECSNEHNLLYAEKTIKELIADLIISQYPELKIEDILDTKTLKLTNNYLNYKIRLMIESKQFSTVLITPTDDNKINSKITSTKVFGKSLEELTAYLSNIWLEWIKLIINSDKENAKVLFTKIDSQIDISNAIEEVFNTEIMKYDVWYWGSTRVFRPLQAEICRKDITGADGKNYKNTRYPMNNKPRLEIIELEFTDATIANNDKFRKLCTIKIGNPDTLDKYSVDFGTKYDVISKYKNTSIYIPKVYTVQESGQKYYPIGCVAVEEKDNKSTAPRKTIIVSGDIVFPTNFSIINTNKIQINDIQNDFIRYSRKKGSKKTRRYTKDFKTNSKYEVNLSDELIDKNESYTISSNEKRVKLDNNTEDLIVFFTYECKTPGYGIMGDIIYNNEILPQEFINFSNKLEPDYQGLVAIPNSCLMEINEGNSVIWSFRQDKILNKDYKTNFKDKPIPKPIWIGNGKHSQGTKNFTIGNSSLKRSVIGAPKIDILNSAITDIVKVRNPNREPKFYKIKEKCYIQEDNIIKELDQQYLDLGFGWYGYPIKKYRKYSIFAYLGLMPEGILVHRKTGRKFYFKHYGGVEPNKFIVYMWNSKSKKYTNAIKATNNDTVIVSPAKANDPRYQFKVDILKDNKSYFRLESYEYTNKYLTFNFNVNENANLEIDETNTLDESLTGKRPKGISLDHTKTYLGLTSVKGLNMPNNPTLFYNQPAYGTNVNIVNEKMTRNIDRSLSPQEQYKQLREMNKNKNFEFINKQDLPNELLNEQHPDSIIYYSK